MVKGILFLVAAAIILRTGKRMLADLGGLARRHATHIRSRAVAMVAMSGLPPLAGFGGKWLLLSAMMEKGWYAPVDMALLATSSAFSTWRDSSRRFSSVPRHGLRGVPEAPLMLLVPSIC